LVCPEIVKKGSCQLSAISSQLRQEQRQEQEQKQKQRQNS